MALVTGPSGAGKSITVRRFARSLDEARFRVVYLSHARSTLTGFLRSINRALELPMRQHGSDLFDQAHAHLTANGPDRGPHPVLVLDDAEAMTPDLFDVLRRLTNYALDAEDRFSVLITGTDAVLRTLRDPALEPFNTRLGFVHNLRGFTLEDTRNYVAFQLRYAGARDQLFAEGAIKKLFQASGGTPRRINQLALHALIQGAVLRDHLRVHDPAAPEPSPLRHRRGRVMRGWMCFLVPRDWTGEQALLAARLLRMALDALWEVHGEEMATVLGDAPESRWEGVWPKDIEEVDEDDIPF
jgi:type II secretory pathway predicted ATPase ExeA